MADANAPPHHKALPSHEQARAGAYALIAAVLLAPPSARLLHTLAQAPELGGDGALALAWRALCRRARLLDAGQAQAEHRALFGSARDAGGIDPRAACYGAAADALDGLRRELAALRLARRALATQPEDHLGALCESMRLLIEMRAPLEAQQQLFERHLWPWIGACLDDIAHARGARFYADGARLAAAFFDTEVQGFRLVHTRDNARAA